MKFEAIRRALVRLIEPAATSVTPKSAMDEASEIRRHMLRRQASNMIPAAPDSIYYSAPASDAVDALARIWSSDIGAADVGIKPPDVWTWDAWSKEFDALALPGWAPCRFAHYSVTETEGVHAAVFVFGVVRGAFGLWRKPFDVCFKNPVTGTMEQRSDVLTIVTHLRSGLGLGVFGSIKDASQACHLAERLAPWETITAKAGIAEDPAWADACLRTSKAWFDLGIVPSVNAHAHDPSNHVGPLFIMGLSYESASEGKPEKAS